MNLSPRRMLLWGVLVIGLAGCNLFKGDDGSPAPPTAPVPVPHEPLVVNAVTAPLEGHFPWSRSGSHWNVPPPANFNEAWWTRLEALNLGGTTTVVAMDWSQIPPFFNSSNFPGGRETVVWYSVSRTIWPTDWNPAGDAEGVPLHDASGDIWAWWTSYINRLVTQMQRFPTMRLTMVIEDPSDHDRTWVEFRQGTRKLIPADLAGRVTDW